MSSVSLKKIFKKQQIQPLLHSLAQGLNTAIAVEDMTGYCLMQVGHGVSPDRHAIQAEDEVIGWVVGDGQAAMLAGVLSLIAKQESEKKELARELLERYQEIDLFEDISTQLTTSLETRQLAQLVLQELGRLIDSTMGIIVLLSADGSEFETLAEFGRLCHPEHPVPNQGLIGKIVQAGRPELVNQVQTDPRSTQSTTLQALICVPLRAKERVLGAIALGTHTVDAYSAEHLKLVGIFASQTAVAIEKALLYEQSCRAAIAAQNQAEQLQQAMQDLQLAQTQLIQSEKMSGLGQLIAGVAHEINNPVNFICGNLRYVAEYTHDLLNVLQGYQHALPVPPPEVALALDNIDIDFLQQDLPKTLHSMKIGTDRIVEIVQSLKNFSRHDEAEMKAVNIHDGIDGTLMILRHRLKASGSRPAIAVVKEYGELPKVECYAGQLNQVFMNILANAIDALEDHWDAHSSDPRSTSDCVPTITIRTTIHAGAAIIRIADNGPGMTEELVRRIYDPFFTTKEVGKGTGLGMAISHQIIVDTHQGMLKCRSQPGQGTEFWIQVPLTCATHVKANRPSNLWESRADRRADLTSHHLNSSNSLSHPDLLSHANHPSPAPERESSWGMRAGNPVLVSSAIAPAPLANGTAPALDPDGFIPAPTPRLNPTDPLMRHTQLIQQLVQQNADGMDISPEQIFQLFQHHPITLKLYATLLSHFYCPLPTHPAA